MNIQHCKDRWEGSFEHRPSWRASGSGHARISVARQADGGLFITALEAGESEPGKRFSCKEVMFGLPPQLAASLIEWIKTYGEVKR